MNMKLIKQPTLQRLPLLGKEQVQLFLLINFFIEREIIAIKKNTVPISCRPSIPNMFSDKYIAMAKIIIGNNVLSRTFFITQNYF